jgi:hypothetical protein
VVDDCVHFGQLPPLGSVLGEFCVLEVLIEVRVLDVDLKYSDKILFFTSQDEEKYLGGQNEKFMLQHPQILTPHDTLCVGALLLCGGQTCFD